MDILTYALEQPRVVERVLKEVPRSLEAIPGISGAPALYLVGSGTSLNALAAVEPLLAGTGKGRVRTLGPLAFLAEARKGVEPGAAALVLSQTGASTTTIRAVEEARGRGLRTLTLTAEGQSPIARVSPEVLLVPAGPEAVGPKTKGYTASVLTLLLLILREAGRKLEIPRFPAELSALIDHCKAACAEMAGAFGQADFILVMGQGRHFATALEGSLKITEMSGIPSAPFDTEEAFHGRFHGLGGKSLALFVTAGADQQEMAVAGAEVLSGLGVGARILNLGGVPSSPYDCPMPWPATGALPELDLLGAIVPFQLLAWHLAGGKGVVPEKMRYPGLSQKLGIKTRGKP